MRRCSPGVWDGTCDDDDETFHFHLNQFLLETEAEVCKTIQDRFNSNVRLLPPEVAKVLLGAAEGSKLKLFKQ